MSISEYPFPPDRSWEWQNIAAIVVLVLLIGAITLWIVRLFWRQPSGSAVVVWFLATGVASMAINTMLTTAGAPNHGHVLIRIGLTLVWVLTAIGSGVCFIVWSRVKRYRGLEQAFAAMIFAVLLLFNPFILSGVVHSWEAPRRNMCRNNLKQIGLALHNYFDDFQSLPTGPLQSQPVSWRVELLPYLDHSDLYREYHLDEIWDSLQNRQLQPLRPREWHCLSIPGDEDDAESRKYTSYQALSGPETIYDPVQPVLTFREMADGISQTIGVVEACGTRRIWTDPHDVDVSRTPLGINLPGKWPNSSGGALSSYHAGGAFALMLDGSVRFLSEQTDPEILQALATPRGGEPTPEYQSQY